MCGVRVTRRALRLCFHHIPVTFYTLLTAMAFPGATVKKAPDRCGRKGCAITRQSFFPCLQLLSQVIKITFEEVRKTDRDSYLSNPSVKSPQLRLSASLDQLDPPWVSFLFKGTFISNNFHLYSCSCREVEQQNRKPT